jgi:undecaprenyl-diphosphatase
MVFVGAVVAPLTAFIPFGVKAWEKDAFAWDVDVSQAVQAYESRQTVLNRYVDVLGLVLHPAVQGLGALLVFAVLLALVVRKRHRSALLLGLSVAGAVVGASLLKDLFKSPPVDPQGTGYSFPSGHALRTMAAAAALTVLAWSTAWRWTTVALGAISVALVGVAVVYHEWHRASDVIAGWCLGVAWVACVWLALRPRHPAGSRVR